MDSEAVLFAEPEDSRAITSMDATHRSGSALSLGIDAYGTSAGAGNAGPSCALTKNTGKAAAGALSNYSIGWSNTKDASTAISCLGAENGGDVRIVRISNYIFHGLPLR
jgi:hypothetical protein